MDEQDKIVEGTESLEENTGEQKLFSEEEITQIMEQMNKNYEEIFQMEDIENRKLYINYQIDNKINEMITYHILRYNALDKDIEKEDRLPIKIYINSEGGSVCDGLSCLAAMKLSKTPVYTITFGYCNSMGFQLFLGGNKRFASPDATFMNHSGSIAIQDNTDRVIDAIEFLKAQEKRNDNFILSKTKLTKKQLQDSKRSDRFYFADEAYKLGIATELIGVTCDIDEVL